MKILWLIPVTVDRAFQFTSRNELARGLQELGHRIETVVGYREEQVMLDGFSKVEYVHTGKETIFAMLHYHWRMLRAAFHTDADVVMFGVNVGHLIPIAWLRGLWGKKPKLVLDIRTVPVEMEPGLSTKVEILRYNLAVDAAERFCDGITVITSILGETIRGRLKRLTGKIGVWASGVCLEHFEREGPDVRRELGLTEKRVLFHHGTLSPNRGLQAAIQALALLKGKLPDLVFLIVGDGKGRALLEAEGRKAGVEDRILFTGKVPYREISKYVRSCDVAILPFPDISWWAVSSPIKLMEYLAMGVRIVATDIPAHRWLTEQTGGIMLAKDATPEVLAATLMNAFSEPHHAVPREELERTISWRRQAARLIEFIGTL
jgi:glycosyltransferase involved in cell wall biosynthesis